MFTTKPICRKWFPVHSQPLPGLSLDRDGYEIDGKKYQRREGVTGLKNNHYSIDKEAGIFAPIVVTTSFWKILLVPNDRGEWFGSDVYNSQNPVPPQFPYPPSGNSLAGVVDGIELIYDEPGQSVQVLTGSETDSTTSVPPPSLPQASDPPSRTTGMTTLFLVLATILISGCAIEGSPLHLHVDEQVLAHFRFNPETWLTQEHYHTVISHVFLHQNPVWLAYAALGLGVFGWIVQRHIGILGMLGVYFFCAASSIGVWQLAKTPLGEDIYWQLVAKAVAWIADKWSIETGFWALGVMANYWQQIQDLQGDMTGAGGALAGLIAFAMFRRGDRGTEPMIKPGILLLSFGYLAGAFLLWRQPEPFGQFPLPYVIYIGGVLGGLFFIFPERYLKGAGEYLRSKESHAK